MQHLATIAELKSRAEAVGSSLRRLALEAGVAPSTAYRGLKGEHDTGSGKIRRMMAALAEKEHEAAQRLRTLGVDAEGRAA